MNAPQQPRLPKDGRDAGARAGDEPVDRQAGVLDRPSSRQRAGVAVMVAGLTALTAGSVFLMWLGEQIDKYGIGNGVSLILTAGILAQMPTAVSWIVSNFNPSQQKVVLEFSHRGLKVLVCLLWRRWLQYFR